jgi:hypothetical protein
MRQTVQVLSHQPWWLIVALLNRFQTWVAAPSFLCIIIAATGPAF